MEEKLLTEPMRFEHKDRVFLYDFTRITVEQAELARELAEFKIHQNQQDPETFVKLLKSRGVDYLPIMMSYLLVEVKNGEVVPWSRDKAELENEKLIKTMPATETARMRECVQDFFTAIEMSMTGSTLLQSERKQNGEAVLFQTLGKMMLTGMMNTKES